MSIDSEKQSTSPDSNIIRIVENIKTSDNDPWNYRGLELSNEMLVVLISHPNIDKAAAALDVSIGSLADPLEVPGIAHFLEHMLFMGSEKVIHLFLFEFHKFHCLLYSVSWRERIFKID